MPDGSLFSLPNFGPWRIDEADCVDWLRGLPDDSVDCIITDCAYESLEKHRAKGTTTRLKQSKASSNEWFPIFGNERFPELFREMHRVLAANAHLYFYADFETARIACDVAERARFKVWTPIVWDKVKIGMGYHYRSRYELVCFFEKGHRNLADLGTPNVQQHARVRGGYPTEKPESLNAVLVAQSTIPGEIVCDPFCGSGSTGAAALKLGRRFLGCDVKASAVTLARARVADVFAATMQAAGAGA